MRLKLIACKALFREVSLISAYSQNFIDATFMRQGLHDTPDLLRQALQEEIDKIDAGDDVHTFQSHFVKREFDAILLGYGLCSNGIVGLGSKKYPLVVPRAHDCITLFLGSKEKYAEYFNNHSGTFWYNASWIENSVTPSEQSDKEMLEVYKERYGEENAEFLMEAEVTDNYDRAAYIKWPELSFPQHEEYTRDAAKYRGWELDIVEGDSSLLLEFLDGNWEYDKFLVVPPGHRVESDLSGSGKIIKAGK
ncbi:DUF1638 domain-containing protein [Christensenellaceae bacterium OttesenSCG-928-K19]|nr:DUF1638 domain-containing protein [Christensenellaceae bacterium OttesenSCG-928-K19]